MIATLSQLGLSDLYGSRRSIPSLPLFRAGRTETVRPHDEMTSE
jgi:hypothetical protein